MSEPRYVVELEEDDHGERTTLVVKVDGVVTFEDTDCGEPEDNTYGRDWSWVPGMLEAAYALGLQHGRESAK